ncbi:MAG: haloacid dehalogenase-like hydrolase, partial [Burkholderiales bacterium]|nr:haloacid dehalogenase-like hydrolase [Burkholderiales bacterium]
VDHHAFDDRRARPPDCPSAPYPLTPSRLRPRWNHEPGSRLIPRWKRLHGDILRALELQYDMGLMSAQAVAATEAPYFSGRSRENITSIMRDVPLIEGIRETLQELHRRSVFTVLNTWAWRFMASAVGDRFGFDEWTGARMNCGPGGLLTGAVARHFDERDKVRAVARLAHRFGVPMSRIAAVGDARSDIPLFRAVGFSIALNGSAQARAAASVAVATPWLPDILRALRPHFLPAED